MVSGVVNVKVDISANKLTVIGKVDPAKVWDDLAEKYQTKVEIVFPQPKKDAAAGNKKPDDKPEKKADKKKSDDKKDQDKKSEERECAKLKRFLEEEKKHVRRLILEKDDEVRLAKRQIEEKDQELAHARKDAKLARKDADAFKNEWTKVKREVKEKEKLIKLLKLETQEIRQVAVIQVEEISRELEEARNDADIATNKCIEVKKDLQEKLELIQMLKLECQETSERATRQVEEKELELADTLNAVTSASLSSSTAQACAICLTNEKDLAFGCGHMTCEECGKTLPTCPICREHITIRIKLFHG
ncbi:hypothetical protein K1719_023079 [Acacia pycnantha]|nr:hypothetical protein K1719_023079 [Acacia pycnantha]